MFHHPSDSEMPTSRHAAVGAWFFGPKAENYEYFKRKIEQLLEEHNRHRSNLYNNDPAFITRSMQASGLFKEQLQRLDMELAIVGDCLMSHSVPSWSPRYNAHMTMEASMPSMIGYVSGLMHNQNNVALEASPFTSILEGRVGRQLCCMLGYYVSQGQGERPSTQAIKDPQEPVAWGHITCGGSVANLEAIWAARNLKFYPLSLWLAIKEGRLGFLGAKTDFNVELCDGKEKSFMDCSSWELLNLRPSTVLNIPEQLFNMYGVSQTALTDALDPYSVQTTGKHYILKRFGVDEPVFFIASTRHYSWPKGAALAGIGRNNMIDVKVDEEARMCTKALESELTGVLNKRAVYCVVAIIGSTEHGAVDPLDKIFLLRETFQKKGLSFVIHSDAAWGGYFASMIRKRSARLYTKTGELSYVPRFSMSDYTLKQLEKLYLADSITVDPHKSGYCPYPAGGLCYKDGRMRYMVTWTSPIVFRDSEAEDSIGVYGVEGSKPGATVVSVYVSHNVLGLDEEGYGQLLGEAIFTSKRMYYCWATMKFKPIDIPLPKLSGGEVNIKAKLRITPFNMLPAEKEGLSQKKIKNQKEFIRQNILRCSNEKVMSNPQTVELLKRIGGDMTIHAFACNFEVNGKINRDVNEANYLNSLIFQRLSLSATCQGSSNVSNIPLYLTSTEMSEASCGSGFKQFKRRLGLNGGGNLYVLVNVTMSPWPTANGFIDRLAHDFKKEAEDLMKAVVVRNAEYRDKHGFIIQGYKGDRMCGVHLPMFNIQNHRQQVIISFSLPGEVRDKLMEKKRRDNNTYFTLANKDADLLSDLIARKSFIAELYKGIPGMEGYEQISSDVQVNDIEVLRERSLKAKDLSSVYPEKMVFFVYSAQNDGGDSRIFNVDHVLTRAPNIHLSSEMVSIIPEKMDDLKSIKLNGCWFVFTDVNERAMQPLIPKDDNKKVKFADTKGLHFCDGERFEFKAFTTEDSALSYDEADPAASKPLFSGRVTLGPCFVDYIMLNSKNCTEGEESSKIEPLHTASDTSNHIGEDLIAMVELRDRYQSDRIKEFERRFKEIEHKQAEAAIPPWVYVKLST